MATCYHCKADMSNDRTTTCTIASVEYPDGQEYIPIPYTPGDPNQRCHDCHVAAGGTHHPGCDTERCPRCGHQLVSCGCLDKND